MDVFTYEREMDRWMMLGYMGTPIYESHETTYGTTKVGRSMPDLIGPAVVVEP